MSKLRQVGITALAFSALFIASMVPVWAADDSDEDSGGILGILHDQDENDFDSDDDGNDDGGKVYRDDDFKDPDPDFDDDDDHDDHHDDDGDHDDD